MLPPPQEGVRKQSMPYHDHSHRHLGLTDATQGFVYTAEVGDNKANTVIKVWDTAEWKITALLKGHTNCERRSDIVIVRGNLLSAAAYANRRVVLIRRRRRRRTGQRERGGGGRIGGRVWEQYFLFHG